jgi:hypothetical protein
MFIQRHLSCAPCYVATLPSQGNGGYASECKIIFLQENMDFGSCLVRRPHVRRVSLGKGCQKLCCAARQPLCPCASKQALAAVLALAGKTSRPSGTRVLGKRF